MAHKRGLLGVSSCLACVCRGVWIQVCVYTGVWTQVCVESVVGGRCILMSGHPGSGRWPEEAEGNPPKAGAWFTLVGLLECL